MVFSPFYLMTRSIIRDAIKKFSSTQRRPLNGKLKPLFHVSLWSHLSAPPRCQAWSWIQSSCSCTRLSLGPSRHALPASQLWQYLRCFHHLSVTQRPLQPRMGSYLGTGEPAKWTRVCACTCQYQCLLRLPAICGTDKSTRGKGKHSDELHGLGGDSALTKLKEQVLQCPATETKTRQKLPLGRQPHSSEETVQRMNQGKSPLLLGDLVDKNPDWFSFKIQVDEMLPKYKPGEAPRILAKLFQVYVRIMLLKLVVGTVGITL